MATEKVYEAMFLVDPVKAATNFADVQAEIERIITKSDCSVVEIKRFGERRLAYPIRKNLVKHERGCFVLTYFKAGTDKIDKIRRATSLSDVVVRMLITKMEEGAKFADVPDNFEYRDERVVSGATGYTE